MKTPDLPEAWLQYIWKTKQFDLQQLCTAEEAQAIEILHFGQHNTQGAGPDFSQARIRIGGMLWVGDVEIHWRSQEWWQHRHDQDPAYETVILHVVYAQDALIYRKDGSLLPTLVLGPRIAPHLLSDCERLTASVKEIPCAALVNVLPRTWLGHWISRMAIERLEQKSLPLLEWAAAQQNDWEAIFYQSLCMGFGLSQNQQAMQQLARDLPWRIVRKHRHNLFQLQALLFGQAGFLEEEFEEQYPSALRREYEFLRQQYQLPPSVKQLWRFGGMRPANYPTIRLAQFSQLLYERPQLLLDLLALPKRSHWEAVFQVDLDDYWTKHYRLGQPSKRHLQRSLGKQFVQTLLINAVIPFFFVMTRLQGKNEWEQIALDLLEEIGPEDNAALKPWEELGVLPTSALESQGLLHLRRQYCEAKRCWDCAIGHHLLRRKD
jgi:hypothetical protein